MQITESEIVRSVATEMGTSTTTAEAGLKMLHLIAGIEGINPTRAMLYSSCAITAGMRGFDDIFDKNPDSAPPHNIQSVIGSTKDLPRGIQTGINIVIDNAGSRAIEALRDLTQAQIDSKSQKDPNASVESIQEITRRKGGLSGLLFALTANDQMTEERANCYYELGVLMQLVDDFCDTAIDKKDGIQTLMTITPEESQKILLITKQYQKVKALFAAELKGEKLSQILKYAQFLVAQTGTFVN